MAYYVITTLVACAIGILVTSIVKPGTIANFTGLASKEVTGSADITVADFFTGMFSSNIIQTFADGNILQTVVIAFESSKYRLTDTRTAAKNAHNNILHPKICFALFSRARSSRVIPPKTQKPNICKLS